MSIYIEGDIGGKLNAYDSATHQMVIGVTAIDLSVCDGQPTEATLHFRNGHIKPRVVDVVPKPRRASPHPFSLQIDEVRYQQHGSAETVLEAILRTTGAPDQHCRRMVSDIERHGAVDEEALMIHVRRSLLAEIVRPLLDALANPKKYAVPTATLGSFKMPQALSGLSPDDVKKAITDKPCEECGGTGEIEMFNSTVPCSTCKPDPNQVSLAFAQETDFGPAGKPLAQLGDERISLSPTPLFGGFLPFVPITNCRCVDDDESVVESKDFLANKLFPRSCLNSSKLVTIRYGKSIAYQRLLEADNGQPNMPKQPSDAFPFVPSKRVLKLLKDEGIELTLDSFAAVTKSATPGAEWAVAPQTNQHVQHGEPCPECGGSGTIELFTSTEPCGKCVS